jgi:hypothetical protein
MPRIFGSWRDISQARLDHFEVVQPAIETRALTAQLPQQA